jgi:hypothetical protein
MRNGKYKKIPYQYQLGPRWMHFITKFSDTRALGPPLDISSQSALSFVSADSWSVELARLRSRTRGGQFREWEGVASVTFRRNTGVHWCLTGNPAKSASRGPISAPPPDCGVSERLTRDHAIACFLLKVPHPFVKHINLTL